MEFGGVTFVLAEAILGETSAEVTHHRVPRDFRDYAGCGDRKAETITVDNCGLRKWKGDDGQAIDQNVVGRCAQRGERGPHRLVRGAQNIDLIDFDRINHTHRPCDSIVCHKLMINFFTQLRLQLFRIVQPSMPKFFGENDRRGNDGTG